eukprot:NODE_6_length_70510_cov_1.054395.p10 type:complete len:532 gc:universal NODE_6_length_70510_cov_1.054395:36634-38229(+)
MLQNAINELSKFYEFEPIEFVKFAQPGYQIKDRIIYYNTENDAYRGLGNWISKCSLNESSSFVGRGIMIDCSRGAVPLLETVHAVVRLLALLGYNQLFLYTEDTYAADAKLFGYLRGRYTREEISNIDNYCALFSIELIPCIQLLGHLGNLLQFPNYENVKDTSEVLLVGESQTYELINKMIDFWQVVRSKRMHIGLDETYGLGSGGYKKKFGEAPMKTIFLSHLQKVIDICKSKGIRPMMWSDMLFSLNGEETFYKSGPNVSNVSDDIDYVYWDYFHLNENSYKERINQHLQIGVQKNLIMAPGVMCWNRFWTAIPFAMKSVDACVSACNSLNVNRILYTLWGDDLNEYDLTSTFPAIIYLSDKLFNGTQSREKFMSLCGGDWNSFIEASRIDNPLSKPYLNNLEVQIPSNASKWLLWNDPITNFMRPQVSSEEIQAYQEISKNLLDAISTQKNYPLNRRLLIPALLSAIVYEKIRLKENLLSSYREKNISKIEQSLSDYLKPLESLVERLWRAHRYLWMSQYKPFGKLC